MRFDFGNRRGWKPPGYIFPIFASQKVIENRALFPNDEAVLKILYLALRNIAKKWTMPIPNWSAAMNQFALLIEGRVPMNGFGENSFKQII